MATYATTGGAASAPTFGVHPGAAGQDHHLHQQVSQITLNQQYQQQAQQQQQQSNPLPPQQQQHQSPPPPLQVDDIPPAEQARSNSNGLPLGLGFLNKLGLDRKTNRDGQPAKRRGPKPDSKPALTRRQELNRQAQRTHRQRKEVYIKSLEEQVMGFKETLAVEMRARHFAEDEIRHLRGLLNQNGITIPPSEALPSPQHYGGYSSATSDGGLGSSNGDYATPSSYQASGSVSDHEATQRAPASAVSAHSNGNYHPHQHMSLDDQQMHQNRQENQLCIDFVLALEAFCNDHSQYLCVRSSQSTESELPVASGHALMLSCPPLSHIEQSPSESYPHKAPDMPVASLATLLSLSKELPLNGNGEVTPIIALSMIQSDPRYPRLSVKEFKSIMEELKGKTRCYGFGAVLEEFEVRDAVENVFAGRPIERI